MSVYNRLIGEADYSQEHTHIQTQAARMGEEGGGGWGEVGFIHKSLPLGPIRADPQRVQSEKVCN